MNYIIIIGTPIEGLNFIGPFDNITPALNYARKEYGDDSWWIKELVEPGENTRPNSTADPKLTDLCDTVYDYIKDKMVIYKDGNSKNYDIANLELVPIPEINTSIERMQYEDELKRYEDKINNISDEENFADRESYASSVLPGIEDHDILDRINEEDLPL
jgi:hypothetical protein